MVDLIAKHAFTYARRALRVGDRFSAHEGDVRVLMAIGHAARPDAPAVVVPAPPGRLSTPDPVPPPVERPPADEDPTGDDDDRDEEPDDEPDEEPAPTPRGATAAPQRRPLTRKPRVGR